MTEVPPESAVDLGGELPEAEIRRPHPGLRLSIVWLLPLVAALTGGWMVYRDYAGKGPFITIRFANAEGIMAQKTRVKYRDVEVGKVEEVRFSDDLARVVVSVRLDREFEGRMTESTRFWVVRPRIEGLRISGLETLISGAYITMDLGQGGEAKSHFEGLEEPRSILSDTPGTFFTLRAPGLGSLAVGSPVYFRQLTVGEVVKYRLSENYDWVEIDIFVRAPYDSQVYANSRFWNVSGVKLDLNVKGLRVGFESLAALLAGGVAFETPTLQEAGSKAETGAVFTLFPDQEASQESPVTITQPYLLNFADSVRGLAQGAPVEFHGVRVGTVTDIGFEGGAEVGSLHTPVTIAIEPDRMPLGEARGSGSGDEDKKRHVRRLLAHAAAAGLRARLQTGNLLTGQMFIELDFVPDAPKVAVDETGPIPELPTAPGTFGSLTRSVSHFLSTLERLPLEEIGRHLVETAAGLDHLVNREEVGHIVTQLDADLTQLNRVLGILETGTGPMLHAVAEAGRYTSALTTAASTMVKGAEATLGTLERTFADNGPLGHELLKTLEELAATARSIRLMADYLERHPEALIQGKVRY